MVQALINLEDNTNRVLNVVKAKYKLKDKSEAIEFLVDRYIEDQDEPELRPEFIKKLEMIEKQKSIRVKNFAKRYGLK
jgi:metal-responsive CopG/Arc/MetJ family transcriptional regulator